MKTFTSIIPMLLLAGLAGAGELTRNATFRQGDLSIARNGVYDVVSLAGCPASTELGYPRLPRLVEALSIPAGAVVTSADVVYLDELELDGTYRVGPAQPPVPVPAPGVTFLPKAVDPDPAVYGRNADYPEYTVRALTTGTMCGYSIGQVEVRPVRYNPVTGKLTMIRSLTYRVQYEEGRTASSVATSYQRTVFGARVRGLVANPERTDAFAPPVRPGRSKSLPAGEYRCVTISGSAGFDTVFARLSAWKTRKGMRDTVVNVSSIYSAYTGWDCAEKVRNFIKDARSAWGTVYVLLAGQGDDANAGQNLVPIRRPWYLAYDHAWTDSIPSDLYYSDLDRTWDADNDHRYGEVGDSVDLYPDVFVGRAPVLTVAQARIFVAKTLAYEKSPAAGYLEKMLLPTAILWESDPPYNDPYDYEERTGQRLIAAMTPAGWTDDSLFERNGNLSALAVSAAVDEGRGMGNWIGHGNELGIYLKSGGTFYNTALADAASNGASQGIAISNACKSGGMDLVPGGDCLAEHMVNRDGGGFVGVIMNSRYGWGNPPALGTSERVDTTFYSLILRNNVVRLGQSLAAAKGAWVPEVASEGSYGVMRWTLYELNLFGDPELPLWTSEPESLQVTHAPVVPIGASQLTVTVQDKASGSPVQGALVCVMHKRGDSYDLDTTDAAGQASLAVNAFTPDTVYVTVTAQGRYPYEGHALAQSPGPYVLHLKHSLTDAGGNGDGIANPGETVRLPTWVKNYGNGPAASAVGTLRALNPSGIVTADSSYSFGTLGPGDSACYAEGYGLYLSPGDTNGAVVPLTLECRDAYDSVWNSGLSVTVGTAVLWCDSTGISGNGRLDPDEAARLGALLRNSGLGYAYNTEAVLRCSDVRVTVTDSTAVYGTIEPGATAGSGTDSFGVSVGPMPGGTPVGFTLVMRADGVGERTYAWNETVGDMRDNPTPDNASTPVYYAVEDSDKVERAPVFSWREIRGAGGTQLPMGDETYTAVDFPQGFAFRWYGTEYGGITVSSNGWIGLGTSGFTSADYTNTILPWAGSPKPAVFPLWDDLDPGAAGWVGYYHDAGYERFIVEYDSVPFWNTPGTRLKLEVMFCDSAGPGGSYDHDVVIQYQLWNDLGSSTVGFQDTAGTVGAQLLFNGAWAPTMRPLRSGRAVLITPVPKPWGDRWSGCDARAGDEAGRELPEPGSRELHHRVPTVRRGVCEPGGVQHRRAACADPGERAASGRKPPRVLGRPGRAWP